MSRMVLSQPSLTEAGGAECACMMMVERFQDKHDVTLVTGDEDIDSLNPVFETEVDRDKIEVIEPLIPKLLGRLERRISLLAKLQATALNRYIRKHLDSYDIHISCKQEGNLGEPGIQFIHHPPDGMVDTIHEKVYLWILSLLGRKKAGIKENTTICWGDYLKKLYERTYNVPAESIMTYSRPPENFKDIPWNEREDGILIIGRIHPEKRTHIAIQIVDELVNRGIDTHLHIIGKGSGDYYDDIRGKTEGKGYVHLEGFVSSRDYYRYISNHKYLIHCRRNEPSAQTVIDSIVGGCIPIAHDSGGNKQILNYNEYLIDNLLYHTPENAVDCALPFFRHEQHQLNIRKELSDLSFNTREEVLHEIEEIISER